MVLCMAVGRWPVGSVPNLRMIGVGVGMRPKTAKASILE